MLAGDMFLQVAQHDVSDIPQSSQIGRPSSLKNSSSSTGVGAAPTTSHSHLSRPSAARIAALSSPGSEAGFLIPFASSEALIFSQIRGTEPQAVGLTSGRCATTVRGSAIEVIVKPKTNEHW